tara:strand:- start:168 stop:389 length:222 start_codon:yes stop_codon:yes gene_type:complete
MKNENEEYVRDGLGWIDDFRAPAGIMGHPITRQIMIHSALHGQVTQLHELQYDKEEVRTVMNLLLDQVYNEDR